MTTIEDVLASLIAGQSLAGASTRQGALVTLWRLGMGLVGASPRASTGTKRTWIRALLATDRVLALC